MPRKVMPNYQQTLAEVMRRAEGGDPFTTAYNMRWVPGTQGYRGGEDDPLRDVEHYLFARDQARLGPLEAYRMFIGTPAHIGMKMLGMKTGDYSMGELLRGWQGAGAGFSDWVGDVTSRQIQQNLQNRIGGLPQRVMR